MVCLYKQFFMIIIDPIQKSKKTFLIATVIYLIVSLGIVLKFLKIKLK